MRRKNKSMYIVLILIVLFGVSIGYAAISRTLNITGVSNVEKNTWDIHFENVKINGSGVTASIEPDVSVDSSLNFEVKLDLPGDFYEFTVEVHNDGTIDAMVDSIEKIPELTAEQKKYLNYIIEYENGEQINVNNLVKAGEYVKLKVRVEYRKDLNEEDLPSVTETLNLGFTLNYVQADSTGIIVKDNGVNFFVANGLLEDIGTIVTIGTEQFYTIGTEGDNVKLLAMYNLYVGNDCPSATSISCTPYGSEATGLQDSKMIGTQWSNRNGIKGVTPFSSEEKHGTSFTDYNGSIVEGYVNNYKSLLENNFGVDVLEARLITYEELVDPETFDCYDSCASPYTWLYNSVSFWTSSSSGSNFIYAIHVSKQLTSMDYSYNSYYGVRPVIVIPKNVIKEDVKVILEKGTGDISSIGATVKIGTEEFYTIGIEGENVKLFARYNLYVGAERNSSSGLLSYGDKATGVQHYTMKGQVTSGSVYRGVTAFSNEGTDFFGSLAEKYVNEYEDILEEKYGIDIVAARLITYEELTDTDGLGGAAVDFIHTSSYWTGTSDGPNFVYFVDTSGEIFVEEYSYDYRYGIRPVIIIPKLIIE